VPNGGAERAEERGAARWMGFGCVVRAVEGFEWERKGFDRSRVRDSGRRFGGGGGLDPRVLDRANGTGRSTSSFPGFE
jgi:hypothetical protein